MSGEVQAVPILHLSPVQVEVSGRPSAGMMIPPVCEQDTADIDKQRRDLMIYRFAIRGFVTSS